MKYSDLSDYITLQQGSKETRIFDSIRTLNDSTPSLRLVLSAIVLAIADQERRLQEQTGEETQLMKTFFANLNQAVLEAQHERPFVVNLGKETIKTLMRLSKHYGQTPEDFLTSLVRASDQEVLERTDGDPVNAMVKDK